MRLIFTSTLRLQFNLLKEITENWIPENCQFWTASHSLGFIDYARQYEKGVIIDFDDLDFDQPQTLFPQPKDQLDVYDIAVPKETLLTLMSGKKLVVCENKNDQYFNLLAIPNTIFIGVNNSSDVFLTVKRDRLIIQYVIVISFQTRKLTISINSTLITISYATTVLRTTCTILTTLQNSV